MHNRSKVRVFLVIIVFILAAISYIDRANISVAGALIMPEFGINKQQLGYILTAFLIGYGASQVPGGWLARRYGPRKVLTWGLLWWGVFTAGLTLITADMANAFVLMLIMRFLLGMGEAVMYPSSNQITATWIPTQERGLANGVIFAGTGTGAALASPLITWLMTTYGWREAFLVSALIGVVAAGVWYVLARDTPEEHKGVNAEELAYIKAGLTGGKSGVKVTVPWGKIFGSKDVLLIAFAYFCFCWVAFLFLSWFFIYVNEAFKLNLASSAVYAMLPPAMMVVGSVSGGAIADRICKAFSKRAGRCIFAAASLFGAGLLLVLGSSLSDPMAAVFVLAGGAGCLYLAQSPYWALAADFGGPHAGVVSGLMNTAGMVGGALTASVTPWLAGNYGWAAAFYVGAGFVTVGAVAWLLVDPGSRVHHPEDEQVMA
jgi:ACS family glucarate transporter-like MFS transporter